MAVMPHFKDRDKRSRTSVRMLPSAVWLFAYTAVIVFIFFTSCPRVTANTETSADESRNSGASSLDPNSEKNIERLVDFDFAPIEGLKVNQKRNSDDVSHRAEWIPHDGSKGGSNQPTAENLAPATNRQRGFSASAQMLPRTCHGQVCYRMIIDAMSWERAQEHCRSQGGFLADYTQSGELHRAWTNGSRSSNRNDYVYMVAEDIIWTGLTKYRNHYQWLTEYAEYAPQGSVQWDPAPLGSALGPWLAGCPAFNASSNTFHLISCSDPLHFACFDASQKEEEQISNEIELRISYTYDKDNFGAMYIVTSQNICLSLESREFNSLHLKCNFYNKTSGETFDKKNAVVRWIKVSYCQIPSVNNWKLVMVKDDIFLQHRSPKIRVIEAADDLKQRLFKTKTHLPDELASNQGRFQCESWLPNTNHRLASSELLVTESALQTHVISPVTIDPSDHSPDDQDLTVTIGHAFRNVSPWNDVHKGLIKIQHEQLSNGSYISPYDNRVYLGPAFQMFLDINKQQQAAYSRNSSVKSPINCSRELEDVGFGNVVKWPSSVPGPVSSDKVQCRAKNGLPIQGTCRWDFSKGAYLEKPSAEKCDFVGLCPRGYSSVHNVYCVAITSPGSWETGFRQAYKTSKESNLLDISKKSILNRIFLRDILFKEKNASTTWLPIRRMAKHSPLIHVGFTSSNFTLRTPELELSSNVSWAPGHPLIMKDCLALNLTTLQLFSYDCNESLPYMSVVDLSVLEEALKSNLSANSLGLTETSVSECTKIEGVSPGYSTDIGTCITLKQIPDPSSWRRAYDQCEGDLPQPGKGFMSWIYQKLLVDHMMGDVYMTIGKEKDAVQVNDSQIEYYNWIPGTNIENSFGVIQRMGWTLINNSPPYFTAQFCEKKLKIDTDSTISLQINHNSHSIDVLFTPLISVTVRESLRCFLNGIAVEPSFLSNGEVQVNLENNQFGYCFCYIWKRNPVMWIKSNELFFRQSSFIIYFVELSQFHETYQQSIHDSTFLSHRSRTHCQNVLLNELAKCAALENISTSIIMISPDKLNEGISELISIQIPYASNVTDSVDEALALMFPDLVLPVPILDTNCSVLQIRKTSGCRKIIFTQSLDKLNISFDSTAGSGTFGSNELCVSQAGVPVTRQCYGDDIEGYYWSSAVDGQCSTFSSSNTTRQLIEIQKNLRNGIYTSDSVLNVITNSSELLPIDILSTVNTLHQIILHNNVNNGKSDTLKFKDLVGIVDTVLSANKFHFESLNSTFNITNKLLNYFETLAFTDQMDTNPGDSFQEESKTLISSIRVDVTTNSSLVGFSVTKCNDVDEIKLVQRTQIGRTKQGIQAEIIFPKNLMHSLNSADRKESTEFQVLFSVMRTGIFFHRRDSDPRTVNSLVIQASIHGYPVRDLNQSEPVRLTFKPLIRDNFTVCVFWNVTKNSELGGWSTEGCKKGEGNGSLVTCFCSHLTTFALLTKSDDVDKSFIVMLKTITSYLFCLSLLCLLIFLSTFFFFTARIKSKANLILSNNAIAVFFFQCSFLFLIGKTDNPIVCRSVGASLNFFFQASISWRVVHVLHLLKPLFDMNCSDIHRLIYIAPIFAWGVPLLLVSIILLAGGSVFEGDIELDAGTKMCWISAEGRFFVIFPVAWHLAMTVAVFSFSIAFGVSPTKNFPFSFYIFRFFEFFFQLATFIIAILIISSRPEYQPFLCFLFIYMQGIFIFSIYCYQTLLRRKAWRNLFAIEEDSQDHSSNRRRDPENFECSADRIERIRLDS